MREHLYKGKRIRDNEWTSGGISYAKDGAVFIVTTTKDNLGYITLMEQVYPETVIEYTGLCDKNGNKIFEGDILQNEPSYVYSREYRNVVVFDEGEFYGEGSCPFLADEFKYCEVIGNKIDNNLEEL